MSYTSSRTFTKTDARYVMSKVKTQLGLMRVFYGSPSEDMIERYGEEAALLLAAGYLKEVTYGFRRAGKSVPPTVRVTAAQFSNVDDLPGGVLPGENISGATFGSYLEYSDQWFKLSLAQRRAFEETLPIQRTEAVKPGLGNGVWVNEKSFSSNGQGVRSVVLRSR